MMTRRDVATLAFKLFALWLMTQGISGLVYSINTAADMVSGNWDSWFESSTLYILAIAFIGVIVWWKATWLAKRIFPRETSPVGAEAARASYQAWLGLGICLIGLWLLAMGILGIIPFLMRRSIIAEMQTVDPQPLLSDPDFWGLLVKLVVGLLLAIGSRGLSRLLWKIRHGGLENAAERGQA